MRKSVKFAELVGIILGDGSIYVSVNRYILDIAFNLSEESFCKYVEKMLKDLTRVNVYRKYDRIHKCVHLRINRTKVVKNILSLSIIRSGDKIKNQVSIPYWIRSNKRFLKVCIRGLIDTDGSFYRLKPQWPNLFQLSFKNNNKRLLKDTRMAFTRLGFHPSKVFGNRIVITRQKEIRRYLKIIGTNRLVNSPVV